MATSSSAPSTSNSATLDTQRDLIKQIRSHEVALNELKDLSSFKAVYQRHGNIFFRSTTQKATASEQKQLDLAKAKLLKLSSS